MDISNFHKPSSVGRVKISGIKTGEFSQKNLKNYVQSSTCSDIENIDLDNEKDGLVIDLSSMVES